MTGAFFFLLICGLIPWFLFTGIFLIKKPEKEVKPHAGAGMKSVDGYLQNYFHLKMNRRITINCEDGKIIGYCLRSDNGQIIFYLENHQPVFAIQKMNTGWCATKIFQSAVNPKEILNHLILYLEQTLYN